MNQALVAAIALGIFFNPTMYAIEKSLDTGRVLTGTINVIAVNRNGMVVLTDSALSYKASNGAGGWIIRQRPENGQKLFRIDDHTVCTFAGFANVPTPGVPDFLNDVSAIIGRYQGFLSEAQPTTVEDKLQLLQVIFGYYLRGIAALRASPSEAAEYKIQLFLAGYNPDGALKVGSLILGMGAGSPARGVVSIEPVVLEQTVFSVEGQIIFLHGQKTVALQVLQQSGSWIVDAEAGIARANSQSQSTPLGIEELRALAISLKQQTAVGNPTVGGPEQIAILTAGRVQSIAQPAFSQILPARYKFFISWGNDLEGVDMSPGTRMTQGAYVGPELFTLYLQGSFKRVSQQLDEAYFSGNIFRHCQLLYNGGKLQFQHSNLVYDSDLMLGPGVDRNAPDVMYLMYNFPWKHVGVQGEFTAIVGP